MNPNNLNDFKMNIDPNLKHDTVLEMGENKVTYGDLSDMFPIKNMENIKCLIYWDDIMQLTSLSLIEVINSLLHTNAKVDIEHFLSRDNYYIYGMRYVYKLFENLVSKEDINKIKQRFYWKILEISLKTGMFMSINKMTNYFTKLGFYFPYKFENWDTLLQGFKDIFFKDIANGDMNFHFASDGYDLNNVMEREQYNCIITPNIADTYNYILQKDLKRITILGPDNHNGITDELYQLFYKYRNIPKPNYCDIKIFRELIMRPSNS